MRAARYYDQKDIRIEDIPEMELLPGTVEIEVAWCGICGTDLHEYLEGPIFVPPAGHPHPISGESAPVTLGHEFSGTVTALGEGVTDLKVGENVVVEPYIINDDVDTSKGQSYHLSKDMNFIGLGGRGGGLSEKIVVKRRWVHPIGDIPLDQAALIEPLSVGHHAFVRSEAKAGQVAIVGGAGPIGLLTAAVLKAEGLTVYISELSEARKAKARETGVADDVFDPREVNVAEKVRELTGGKGADVGFECSSVPVVLDMLLDAVKPGGVVVNVSIWGHKPAVDMPKIVLKEIDLRGTIGYAGDHPDTIALVQSGKLDLAPFITGRIGLDELVSGGFEQLINNNEHHVKIIVNPKA
ncbi:2,3-butanediol dehydrogenase [Neomicrococcus lactis]|uniref:(R,R)-butanediol dehydrogenase/meso-butanediol dehydrogenase/diacetyl reductase n=2 Tax=Neomicrococcus TaxID=1868332 RepID=A0A7W8WYI3_9MICC|nr:MULTISPECIES: 2,3-butanediol dehydrogenase [Neomicrococcus]MBB5512361.1 (R,R)-butanediol dehydrogenase/meso-butanediol dehydrogenase/diacetyl reductase [Neomicrococcus aestuarii]MBB5598451.1 (R,R)-butanediol dehydrogenase/meso-butanediol dehydrogenase/diacetyl reductase [Neomicrococcus lactis]